MREHHGVDGMLGAVHRAAGRVMLLEAALLGVELADARLLGNAIEPPAHAR